MPATVNATVLSKLQSTIRATPASAAGVTSADVLTLNHGLGASPDRIIPVIRSVVAVPSGGQPNVAIVSWDATRATLVLPGKGVDFTNVLVDVFFSVEHSIVR